MTMPTESYEVPPRSRDSLVKSANELRKSLRIATAKFPILEVVEVLLPQYDPEFSFEVRAIEEMGDYHGLTRPESKELILREDVYEGARKGAGRDRFTVAHELGHYLLHNSPGLARTIQPRATIPAYKCSEWQANAFAGALLIPENIALALKDPHAIAQECGVSVVAADVQLKILRQKGRL